MAELPTELYDLVARLDHAAAVYNWLDCTEAARKIEALRAENTSLAQLRVEACRLWNLSDQRHADLYEVSLSTIDEATGERVQLSNGDT